MPSCPLASLAVLLLMAGLAGCGGEGDAPSDDTPPAGSTPKLEDGTLAITARPADGTFDVLRGGEVVIRGATADALIDDGAGPRPLSLRGPCDSRELASAALACVSGPIELGLRLEVAAGGAHLTAVLTLRNAGPSPVTVLRLSPLFADAASGGALLLGERPATHRILENGRFVVFDNTAQLELGDAKAFPLGKGLNLPVRGDSVSNWNHIVADAANPARSLVAGYLTFERSVPTLGVGHDDDAAPEPDGRTPFSTYAADTAFVFHGKQVPPGGSLDSETLYLDPLPADPLEALERYADVLAAAQKITAWPRRGPGHEVPNGWNSWTGGSSTGGYGQDINEPLFFENMSVFKDTLLPFGNTYFQLDDGWQKGTGDWSFRPDRFPSGGAGVAAQIAAAGLKPGLWIAPFLASPGSDVSKAHPDWLMPAEGGPIAAVAKDGETLDLTNPEVLDHLGALFSGIKQDGFSWVKADFTYWDVLARPQKDPSLTNIEAYRQGFRRLREALGPDVFLLGIGIMGANVGVVDGMRLTLDNGPKWDEASATSALDAPRAFKGTVRTGARRWFYQNRIWVNHDDLLFFRSWPDGGAPALTLDESRTFAAWIGLSGGSVEIGDKLPDMAQKPAWIDTVRRLLPVYPEAATPLDVLSRDYPEVYRQKVSSPAGAWTNVGLFNWGTNRDLSATPPKAMPEETRSYLVPCEGECLAYEFWSGEFLGRQTGPFSVSVEPRRSKLIALRTPGATPQLLGSNRHVTQGASDMGPLAWDDATRTLSGTLTGAAGTADAPFAHELALWAPAGFTAAAATVDMIAAPQLAQQGEVVRLGFSLPADATGKQIRFTVRFD
jgi:alpha-galactosidase